MYLSKLILNPRERAVLEDLSNPYQMHRTVMSGFPASLSAEERVLYRLEIRRVQPSLMLLVQSNEAPDWTKISRNGYLLQPAEVKPLDYQYAAGEVFQFRLLANPTRRIKKEENGKTTRVGLQNEAAQELWLQRKGTQHGFSVLSVQPTKITQPAGWKALDGRNLKISQYAVRFDGQLRVGNAESFDNALRSGIGSGKSLGFGLLSIARC